MKLTDIIRALQLLPQSRKHLIWINEQLKTVSYRELLHQPYAFQVNIKPLQSIIKGYFWACRSINDCQCLPRSIALYQYLISAGYEAEHKFGVNKKNSDLAAHAWVECQGEPLNESEDLYQRFTVLK